MPLERETHWSKLFHIVVDSGVWAALSPKARAVYGVLLRHTDDATRVCWPGNVLIAQEAGIHPNLVPRATEELVQRRLVKKWRKDRKNFYHLYPKVKLEDLLPGKMEISTPPQKMGSSPLERNRDSQGRFVRPSLMGKPAPALVDEQDPSSVVSVPPPSVGAKKNPLRRNNEEGQSKDEPAGSASALSEAKASPALDAMKEETNHSPWLIPDKLPTHSFHYQQRQSRAFDRPTPEFLMWLRRYVRLTEEEIEAVFASEYPNWKREGRDQNQF